MSIRLRLTLLYSVILTLTLLAFGALLYLRQAQETLEIERQFLTSLGERFADGRRARPDFDPSEQPPDEDPSRQPGEYAGGYLVRRSADGQEILDLRTPDDVVLPLSDDALLAVQSSETWMETATVEGERVLIYTVPIVVDGQLAEILQMGRSLTTRDQSIRALGGNLLIAGIIAIVVAFGLGWVLAGVSLRPIHRLTETARAIGAERDFSRRVEHAGPDDELGRLATTFNSMLAELQAAYQQVEGALEMQRRFVADVSHELRTPLTTLNGNIELLRRVPPISAGDQADVLSDMAGEGQRLIRLVSDLLTLARAEARLPFRCKPVPVKPIVHDVCRQARQLDPGRPITCDSVLDTAVLGEADALKQVLLILLDNALKYTKGPVVVRTQATDQQVAMSVHDRGPGIEPEVLPQIFERFSRGETGRSEAGTGLGLAIAKTLVEAQNGAIAVESLAGQGTVVIVTLARAVVPLET